MLLGVVLDRQSLVAGEGADHCVDLALLDQAPRRLDGDVRGGVRALDDQLDLLAARLGAGDRVARTGAVELAAGFDQRHLRAHVGGLAERGERPFERRQQADLDRAAAALRLRLLAEAAALLAAPAAIAVVRPACGQRHRGREQDGEQRRYAAPCMRANPHDLSPSPHIRPASGPLMFPPRRARRARLSAMPEIPPGESSRTPMKMSPMTVLNRAV